MVTITVPHHCKITGETVNVKIRAKKWLDFEIIDSPCKRMGMMFFKMCDCHRDFQSPTLDIAKKVLKALQTNPSKAASKILAEAAKETNRNIAFNALFCIADRGVKHEILVKTLHQLVQSDSEDTQLLASDAIEKIQGTDIEKIRKLFKENNPNAKAGAMLLIKSLHNDEALEIIQEGINNPHPKVQSNAIEALVKIQNKRKFKLIKHYLQSASDSIVEELCKTLSLIEIPNSIVDEIEKIILTHPNYYVQKAACIALSKTKNKRTVEILINVLKSENFDIFVRKTACETLGILQAEESIDVLLDFINNSSRDSVLSYFAFNAIANIQHPKVYEFMKQYPDNSTAVAYINKYEATKRHTQ